jgi:hypothetical protein
MFNAWDIAFIFLAFMGLWAGSRLKSLPLLGLGLALALAPLAALQWEKGFANYLVENLGGKGLEGQQDSVAYWLIFFAVATSLFFLFVGFSKLLKALQLEGLDRALGALMVLVILLSCVRLNLKSWSLRLDKGARAKLAASLTWSQLRPEDPGPAWAKHVEQSLPDLSKIAPKNADRSHKKGARP